MKWLCLISLLCFCAGCGSSTDHPLKLVGSVTSSTTSVGNYGHFVVIRNVDGDTIEVGTLSSPRRIFKVRLYEIDTPETHKPGTPIQCYGPEAAAATAQMIPFGSLVTLKADPQLDKVDRYGRTLAYIFKKRTFINLKLVRLGFAHVYHYQGHRGIYATRFDNAENFARKHHLGFWSPITCNGDTKQPAK